MSFLIRALTVGLAAIGLVHSPALAADPDPIGAMLDQQKIKYEVDKDKDYKIVYDFSKEKRTQIVYVSGAAEDFEGIRIRSIFTPAAQLKKNSIDGQMKALLEANGNVDEAMTLLRKRGLAQAAKRAGRTTAQGTIGSYIHMGGKIGVLLEVNCESDFVARTDDFTNLVKDVAMHIAAASPRWVRREDVPASEVDKEKAIYRAQMEKEGKPANVLEKIIEGKLGSYYSQFVLLDQPYIRDDKMSVSQLVAQASAKTGENIQISRFVRFRVGEAAE